MRRFRVVFCHALCYIQIRRAKHKGQACAASEVRLMRWNPEHLTYNICIPPITRNFCEMTHDETEAYFSWFMGVIPQRIAYLSETCAAQLKCDRSELDMSPTSLCVLWRWFLQVMEVEEAPNSTSSRPQKQLTLQTEYILRDMGMYLGETFVLNHKSLHWGYYETPRSDFFVNRPVITGFEDRRYTPPFKAVFEPINMVRVQALKSMSKPSNENDLIELFVNWEKYCVD